MGKEGINLRNFADVEFGLTSQDVAGALSDASKMVRTLTKYLSSAHKSEVQVMQNRLSRAQEQQRALSAPSKEVVAVCRQFYERTIELAQTGLDDTQIARTMYEEFPGLTNYRNILRQRGWGYRLVHKVLDVKAEQESKKN